ncbi:hypothetical protein HispidOSU_005244 [Sigmodon hispidus]
MSLPNKVNTGEENPPSHLVQSHEDLWKHALMEDESEAPRRSKSVSQYPKLNVFEGYSLEGRKIQPKRKQLLQTTLPIYRLERRHEEEIQRLKKEKMKNKKVKERGTWLQFFPHKSFLEQKQRELNSLFMGGMSLLDKKKTQALELSAKGHHSKSGHRGHRENLKPLAQGNNEEATRTQSKQENRKLRTDWWDPTVWGDPVTLAEREKSPPKTCSEFQSDLRKLNFPIGRSHYLSTVFVPREH